MSKKDEKAKGQDNTRVGQSAVDGLVIFSVRPSFFVKRTCKYKAWCNITECPSCGQRAHYDDQHPVNPCTNCGYKPVREGVGRWVQEPSDWKNFWREKHGYWEIRKKI